MNDSDLRAVHFGDPSTLRALFWGELWRGRDNLRVTLRGPRTLSHLRSALVPVGGLAAIAMTMLALAFGAVGLAGLSTSAVLGLTAARTIVMARRNNWPTASRVAQSFIVALVYDIARAGALLARTGYRHRRLGERPLHVAANSHS